MKSYIKKLNYFEDDYPKVKGKDGLKRGEGKEPLRITDYSNKILELVIPDMPITPEQAEVLQEFIKDYNMKVVVLGG